MEGFPAMILPVTELPRYGATTFLNSDSCINLDELDADIAFLGIPHGMPYSIESTNNNQSKAPNAVRRATSIVMMDAKRYDFDFGGPLYDGRNIRLVDCGNVPGNMNDFGEHSKRAELAVRKILAAGALPLIVGGDHAIPIPVLRAYDKQGPITLVHIDAHIDFRDSINGVTEGLSSPIRRASEMPHIGKIFQIGIRNQGSGLPEDVDALKAYGVHLTTGYDLYKHGMEAVLAAIPEGGRYYLTIDADGLDPSIMPGVETTAPGGVTYWQMYELIKGLVSKGRVVGMDIVEIVPEKDVNNISAITAARLYMNMIAHTVRANYFRER